MLKLPALLAAGLVLILAGTGWTQPLLPAQTKIAAARNPATVAAFRKDHPCPSTGQIKGRCPGFVVDHVWSLCLGGPDSVANMRWQSEIESYIKDIFERQECAMKVELEGESK